MLNQIKTLLQIEDNSKDELLQVLIRMAVDSILNYCHLVLVPSELNGTLIKMVVQDYNRITTEGLNSESYSGVTFSYIDGYSDDIKDQLKAHRKLRMF